jgi:hypothetical protein
MATDADTQAPSGQRRLADLVKEIPVYLALAGAAAIVFSILHELPYYYIVGLDFFFLLTPTDLVRLAVFWLPIPSFYLAMQLLGLFIGAWSWGKIESKPVATIDKIKRRVDTWGSGFLFFLAGSSVAIFLQQPEATLALLAPLFVAVGLAADWGMRILRKHFPALDPRYSWFVVAASAIVPSRHRPTSLPRSIL